MMSTPVTSISNSLPLALISFSSCSPVVLFGPASQRLTTDPSGRTQGELSFSYPPSGTGSPPSGRYQIDSPGQLASKTSPPSGA